MKRKIMIGACTVLCATLLCMLVGCITINPKSSSSDSGSSSSSNSSTPSSQSSTPTGTSTDSTWPDNAHTNGVPQPQFAADVTLTLNESTFFSITYSGVAESDAKAYLEQLKDSGFTKVESSTDIAGSISYNATNPSTSIHLSFNYNPSKTMTVALNHY